MASLRRVETLGRTNKYKLLRESGFKTINDAIEYYCSLGGLTIKRKKYPDELKMLAFEQMRRDYNDIVDRLKSEKQEEKRQEKIRVKEIKKIERRQKREQLKEKNKKVTFMLSLKLKITYLKDDKIFYKNITEGPFTTTRDEIQNMIANYNKEDGYKEEEVVESEINYLDTNMLRQNRKPKVKQMMKRGFILRNDWLLYAKDIADYAYDSTEDTCVYHQLSKYLIDPPTGKPTKFIDGERTSPEAIYHFLQSQISSNSHICDYRDFHMQSGVSTELISELCRHIKRNLYAYDEDNKCFYSSLTNNENRNYCPVVYYKLHGHMYILNSAEAIRSVAESNKASAKHVITTSVDEENAKEAPKLKVSHIVEFDVCNALNYKSGIYLLQKSNITEETLKFYSLFKKEPRVKNRDNIIIKISYKNSDDEIVIIACDVNYGQNIDYDKIKNVANTNNIEYINEGIGSVILKILEKSKKGERRVLSDSEKLELIQEFNSCCAACELELQVSDFEIDHIVPLSSGGSNDISNLQPLCKDCHKQKSKAEKELGIYSITDETASYFNKKVSDDIVNSSNFKVWQFVETVNPTPTETLKVESVKYIDHLDLWGRPTKSAKVVSDDVEREKDSYKIDMRKCRRNLAYYSEYNFPVYSVMDIPKTFSGEVQCGMYYVNTENTFPFRGCGWYHEPLIKYGLNAGIISLLNIQLEFIPSNKLNPNHFQKNINTLLQAFESEPNLQKACVNAYIGLMGRTKQISTSSTFSLCPETASEWWCSNDDNVDSDKTVFIRNHRLENGQMLYEGIESYQIISESTTYPIYAMILQMEAIELHKLETLIIYNGGIVLDRNTDAVRYTATKPLNIDNYYWDNDKKALKYQTEESKPLKIERMSNFCRKHTIDLNQFDLKWNITYDYEGTAETKATEIIDSNKSCHIDGRAGTGKSYLTNKVIDEIKKRNKPYLAFSPTNKGARIIGGTTIHSVYYKFKHNKKKLMKLLKNVEYIIIDEISMMVEAFYQLFIMIKKIYPTIKFIISGDFAQLPPVNDSWSGDYKNSPAMYELCDGNRIQLKKCRRADDTLFKLCKNISSISVSDFKKTENTYLNIAYKHKTRIHVNHNCMNRFIEEYRRPYVSLEKDKNNPKSQDLKLCVGMPVIAHTTNKKLNILNSEKFIITEIDENTVIMKENEREIKLKLKDFHKFFYLGFCITIHASQGDTFDSKYSIYDWNFIFFCNRAKYVAMSRATNIRHIQIIV